MIDGIRVVVVRDIRTMLTNFTEIAFRTLEVVLQTIIFAFILTKVVPPWAVGGLSYVQYYALGAIVTSVFWASYSIGREVYRDRESGYLNYLMSLPVPRYEIIAGRSFGGSLRAILTVLPLYGLAAILVPTTAFNILLSLAVLFVFALGLCGLGVTLSPSDHRKLHPECADKTLDPSYKSSTQGQTFRSCLYLVCRERLIHQYI